MWYQVSNIREALLGKSDRSSEQGLTEEVGSYRFLICTVVQYDILHHLIHVSKLLQCPKMQLDVAVDLLTKAKTSLTNYRGTGFVSAQAAANVLCEEMNVEDVLREKRPRSTKKPMKPRKSL